MKRVLGLATAGLFMLWAAPVCLADTVFLKNGDEINGKIVEESDNAIVIKDDSNGTLRSISRSKIDVIVYERKPGPETVVAKGPDAPPVDQPKKEAVKTTTGDSKEGSKKEGTKKEPKKKEGEKKTDTAKTGEGESKTDSAKTGDAAKTEGDKGKTAEKKEGEAEGDKEAESEKPKKNRPEYTEEETKRIASLMQALDTDDPNARGAAAAELGKMGTKGIAAIVDGLQHKRVEARAACATLLGDMGARTAVKQLLEVFYSAMPDKGEAATYQVPFIRALKVAMTNTTGQAYINVEPDRPMVQEGLKKYIEWYNENYDRLPPQIDEEEVEPTDPDYVKKIKEQRTLKLQKKEWPKPPLSVENSIGARKTPDAPIQRAADLDYEKGLPKTDRERAGGLIRDGDKSFGDNFFKKKDQ